MATGRPSKLTPEQWAELKQRVANGEKAGKLAKEYGVSKATVSKRVSERVETIKVVANQLVEADQALKRLGVSEQSIALQLFDDLRSMSLNAASAGRLAAQTAHRLHSVANTLGQKIDDADPLKTADTMKTVHTLLRMGNEAMVVPTALMHANKGVQMTPPPDMAPSALPLDVMDAALAYEKYMGQ